MFAGGRVDDLDCVGVDEDECGGSGVGGADAEVVHPAGAAQGDLAVAVDDVDPDPVGAEVLALTGERAALTVAA